MKSIGFSATCSATCSTTSSATCSASSTCSACSATGSLSSRKPSSTSGFSSSEIFDSFRTRIGLLKSDLLNLDSFFRLFTLSKIASSSFGCSPSFYHDSENFLSLPIFPFSIFCSWTPSPLLSCSSSLPSLNSHPKLSVTILLLVRIRSRLIISYQSLHCSSFGPALTNLHQNLPRSCFCRILSGHLRISQLFFPLILFIIFTFK